MPDKATKPEPSSEKEYFNFLDEAFNKQSNSMVVTLPGLGITSMTVRYCEKNGINYINKPDENITTKNIIDISFFDSDETIKIIDGYFNSQRDDSKRETFVVIINRPDVINGLRFEESYFSSHVYGTHYFGVLGPHEVARLIFSNDKSMSEQVSRRIYDLSGGVSTIARFLYLNQDLVEKEASEIVENRSLNVMVKRLIGVILRTEDEVLEKTGIVKDGEFTSLIVGEFVKKNSVSAGVPIKISINEDLSFEENGKSSNKKLTKSEKDILEFVSKNGVITRDEISEIKWGDDQAEKFSDWAINKAISRINEKLSMYDLVRIPKVGYKVVAKMGSDPT